MTSFRDWMLDGECSFHLSGVIIFFLRSCDISLSCGAIADSMKWEGVLTPFYSQLSVGHLCNE